MAHVPKNKKIADLVRRLHNEAKVRGRAAPLLEEAATNLRLQATEIERLKGSFANLVVLGEPGTLWNWAATEGLPPGTVFLDQEMQIEAPNPMTFGESGRIAVWVKR